MALGAAVMSYAAKLDLTAVADRDRCPDVEVFTEGIRRELDELGPVTDIARLVGDRTAGPASS